LEQKIKVLDAILHRLGVSKVGTNLLRILVRNYRIRVLPEIRAAFQRIANERMGVVQVKVFSATSLSSPEQESLRHRFHDLTQKQVEIEFHLDENLLGGVLAQVQSTIYDGTVRGQLARIREELLKK